MKKITMLIIGVFIGTSMNVPDAIKIQNDTMAQRLLIVVIVFVFVGTLGLQSIMKFYSKRRSKDKPEGS